eukprot:COSAG02_NODE_29769_length_563_cov_1.021552_1_plen_25_part_01
MQGRDSLTTSDTVKYTENSNSDFPI